MWPPDRELARLITASCWRSSMSWTLTSRSMIDGTVKCPRPENILRVRAERDLSAQDGEVFRRAGRFAFLRAVLARRGRRELNQVFAGEAGVAERARLGLGGLVHPVLREVAEAVGGDVLGDLGLGVRGGDQLAAHGSVDAVEARPAGGRRADAQVHFARAGIADHLDDLAAGRAADDRIVDHHHALAADDAGDRVELELDAEVADRLRRLDEGAADVMTADEPHVVRDSALFG